jgi:4,5-DOPA dioxygenase extradiol
MSKRRQRQPAIFFGHGSPMNAIGNNRYTDAWRELGATLERPRTVLAVSAHWYVDRTAVTVDPRPRTLHDFHGFPTALSEFDYPAPGLPELAHRVRDLVAPLHVETDPDRGLDHGTWSVLAHVFPAADVPFVQLSIDATRPRRWHYEIGRRLAPLRAEGILTIGSGNVVHNLARIRWAADAPPHAWAVRYNCTVRSLLEGGRHTELLDETEMDEDARLSVPSPDHFVPLLYVIGQRLDGDATTFPVDVVELGSIGMMTVRIG